MIVYYSLLNDTNTCVLSTPDTTETFYTNTLRCYIILNTEHYSLKHKTREHKSTTNHLLPRHCTESRYVTTQQHCHITNTTFPNTPVEMLQ